MANLPKTDQAPFIFSQMTGDKSLRAFSSMNFPRRGTGKVEETLSSHQGKTVQSEDKQGTKKPGDLTAASVQSIPCSSSGSDDENSDPAVSLRGERNRVRELEDLANWAAAESRDVTEKAPIQSFSHLPDWSTLERPFQLIKEPLAIHIACEDSPQLRAKKESGNSNSTASGESQSDASFESSFFPPATPQSPAPLSKELTAYPQERIIRNELEDRLHSLLDLATFEKFLMNPEARAIFRNWVMDVSYHHSTSAGVIPPQVAKLDQWTEGSHTAVKRSLNSGSVSSTRENSNPKVPSHVSRKAIDGRPSIEAAQLAVSATALSASRKRLLQSLYDGVFKVFITSQLVEMCKMKLGSGLAEKDCSGLGDSFVLTNPRFKDNPIVIVSPGFAAVTGYESSTIIGRNCRFLQGPGTNPKSIQRLRNALRAGEPCVELLLNYRSDGTPFQCLLSMLPLFDQNGALTYFIGGQVNITGEIEACKDLASFIISRSTLSSSPAPDSPKDPSQPFAVEHSPRRRDTHDSGSSQTKNLGEVQAPVKVIETDSSMVKRSRFDWITSKFKSNKEAINLDFGGSDTRFTASTNTFESNIRVFQSTYSRLILFKKHSRAIVFVTPEALSFMGLPTETHSDTYASPLIHTDFLDIVEAAKETHKTKELKASLKKAINNNQAASVRCQLIWSYIPYLDDSHETLDKSRKINVTRDCFVHLTPLIDCSSTCTSYLAVLG